MSLLRELNRIGALRPLDDALANTLRRLDADTPDSVLAAAALASLIETCKMNAVDPHAWIAATLTAIVQGHKQSQIDVLLPWNYSASV